jgi:hypothetical protein
MPDKAGMTSSKPSSAPEAPKPIARGASPWQSATSTQSPGRSDTSAATAEAGCRTSRHDGRGGALVPLRGIRFVALPARAFAFADGTAYHSAVHIT